MDIKELEFNADASSQGQWVDFAEDVRLQIRSVASKEFRIAQEKEARKARRGVKGEAQASAERAMAKALLISWTGITDGGKPLEVNEANKLRVCRIPAYHSFIWDCANEAAIFNAEATAEDAEALKSPPDVAS